VEPPSDEIPPEPPPVAHKTNATLTTNEENGELCELEDNLLSYDIEDPNTIKIVGQNKTFTPSPKDWNSLRRFFGWQQVDIIQ
jgi:hypothetical protein